MNRTHGIAEVAALVIVIITEFMLLLLLGKDGLLSIWELTFISLLLLLTIPSIIKKIDEIKPIGVQPEKWEIRIRMVLIALFDIIMGGGSILLFLSLFLRGWTTAILLLSVVIFSFLVTASLIDQQRLLELFQEE